MMKRFNKRLERKETSKKVKWGNKLSLGEDMESSWIDAIALENDNEKEWI